VGKIIGKGGNGLIKLLTANEIFYAVKFFKKDDDYHHEKFITQKIRRIKRGAHILLILLMIIRKW